MEQYIIPAAAAIIVALIEGLAAIRTELQVLCYGVEGALAGLIETGCNGPCKDAMAHLRKHLNKQAHKGDDAT